MKEIRSIWEIFKSNYLCGIERLETKRMPEGTELFIEDQACSPSYDLAPSPPLSPLSRRQDVSLSQSSSVSLVELTDGGGGGGGRGWEEPNHKTTRKSGPK